MQTAKGSTLIFALIILAFILVSTLSIAAVTLVQKKTSLSTDKSSSAFQMADSAAEIMQKQVYKENRANLSALAIAVGANCSGGIISGNALRGSYRVEFYAPLDSDPITCGDGTWRNEAVRMISRGTFGGTTRAIEIGITPPPDP